MFSFDFAVMFTELVEQLGLEGKVML